MSRCSSASALALPACAASSSGPSTRSTTLPTRVRGPGSTVMRATRGVALASRLAETSGLK